MFAIFYAFGIERIMLRHLVANGHGQWAMTLDYDLALGEIKPR